MQIKHISTHIIVMREKIRFIKNKIKICQSSIFKDSQFLWKMHHIPINSHKNCCYCISDSAETTVPSNTCYIWLYNSTVSFLQSFIWRRQMVQFTVNPVVCPGTQKCSDINWRVLLRTSVLILPSEYQNQYPFLLSIRSPRRNSPFTESISVLQSRSSE